jgi:ferric-dicitrate binding protein FerR (iron transport regulator)
LLHLAGPRLTAPADRAQRVRSAVHSAWQTRTRRRANRRRGLLVIAWLGAAASVAIIGSGALVERTALPLGDPVAVVDQIDGSSNLRREDTVRMGEWIETGHDSRLALRFGDAISVRLDKGSRLRAISPNAIELTAGAVYVDTELEHGGFEVRTPLATARDLGTQFEVRLIDASLRLRVRTGVVQLSDRTRAISGNPGTEITLSATEASSRQIAVHGPEWEWTARLSPPLATQEMSLATFLARIAREQGWTVEYSDAEMSREAARTLLHGSLGEVAPLEAVEVAIATSGLRYRLDNGLLIVLPADARDAKGEGVAR